MSDQTPVLNAEKRERLGTRYSRRLRESGRLPAIVYGHGETPEPVMLDAKDTMTHIGKGERVFSLELGGKQQTVMLKDLQYDHLGTNAVHADFARVDLTERVKVVVQIHFNGDAKGLKAAGAIMMHPLSELEIECQVSRMPEYVEVDVSALEVGDSIQAKDVTLPAPTMKLLSDPDSVVAQIVVQQEEKTGEEAEVGVEGAAEPEVITEKKEGEGEGESEG